MTAIEKEAEALWAAARRSRINPPFSMTWHRPPAIYKAKWLERAVIVLQERERCARIAEGADHNRGWWSLKESICRDVAARIRKGRQ
jgi:hypothetical protein